jgi:membrane protein required for colicin V production
MNGIDYAIIALMLLSIGVGVIRGAIREVMNIAGWVLAYIIAHAFAADFAPYFADWVGEPVARTVISWVAVFLGVLILASLVTSLLSEVVRKLGLSTLDRGVGALIGVARGLLVLLAITLAAGLTKIPQTAMWKEAALTPWCEVAALYARGVLPDAIAAKVRYRVAGSPPAPSATPAATATPKS